MLSQILLRLQLALARLVARVAAGAERIGTRSGVKIIDSLKKRFEEDNISSIEI